MFSGTGLSDLSDIDTQENLSNSFPTPQGPEGDLYLRFFVESGDEFALPAMGIREVLSLVPDQITPIPNVSPLLMGVLNFRGQVIWVSDIGQFLGGSRHLNTERSEISVVVIESQEILVGLAVEEVRGMEWLSLETLMPHSNHMGNNTMSPFLKGGWQGVSETSLHLHLLDPISILRSARWAT